MKYDMQMQTYMHNVVYLSWQVNTRGKSQKAFSSAVYKTK